MVKRLILYVLLFVSATAGAQAVYTFECVTNGRLSGDSCDICPQTVINSRSFNGLIIYRDSFFWKWIDQPYSIRVKPGDIVEYWEHGANPYSERVTIPFSMTPFFTIQGMADSTFCNGTAPAYRDPALFADGSDPDYYIALSPDNSAVVLREGANINMSRIADTITVAATGIGTGTVTSVAATAPAAGFTISGSPITTSGTFVFSLSDDLAALEALSGAGMAARTASNTWVLRTITAGTGISVADGAGTAGNPTITNTGDLSTTNEIQRLDTFTIVSNILRASLLNDGVPFSSVDLSSYAGNGTLTSLGYVAPAAGLSISGTNPATTTATWTYALTNDLAALEGLSSTGIAVRSATDTWVQRSIVAGTGISIADGSGVAGNPTVTNTGDLSATNEIQTYAHSGTSNYTNTLSGGGGSFSINAGTGITVTQTAGAVTITNAGVTTQEQVEDWVGALLDNSARITFTYDDPTASITADIVTNSVGNTFIRQGIARSVIGVTGNGTANVADIQGTANQVLRVNSAGTALAFGQVVPAAILVAANNVVIGNIAGTNQSAQELTVSNLYTLLGLSGVAGRNAFWSGTNTLSNSANWLWDNTNARATIIPQVAGLGGGAAALNINPPGAGALASMEAIRSWGNINGNLITGVYNTNTGASSNAIEIISSGSNAAGDPILQFQVSGSGGTYTAMGLDNSDANKFKLSAAGATYPGNFVNSSFVITQDAVPLYGFNIDAPTVTVDVEGKIRGTHFFNNSSAAFSISNVTAGAGMGTSPTISNVSGGCNFFVITFTTGTSPTNGATILTATFPVAFPGSTWVVFSPRNGTTATDIAKFYISGSSGSNVTLVANGTLSASTTYALTFFAGGYN